MCVCVNRKHQKKTKPSFNHCCRLFSVYMSSKQKKNVCLCVGDKKSGKAKQSKKKIRLNKMYASFFYYYLCFECINVCISHIPRWWWWWSSHQPFITFFLFFYQNKKERKKSNWEAPKIKFQFFAGNHSFLTNIRDKKKYDDKFLGIHVKRIIIIVNILVAIMNEGKRWTKKKFLKLNEKIFFGISNFFYWKYPKMDQRLPSIDI